MINDAVEKNSWLYIEWWAPKWLPLAKSKVWVTEVSENSVLILKGRQNSCFVKHLREAMNLFLLCMNYFTSTNVHSITQSFGLRIPAIMQTKQIVIKDREWLL